MEATEVPVKVPMQATEVPLKVTMQATEVPVMVPMQRTEMVVTEVPIEYPPPSDKTGTVHKEVRFFIVVGFIVIGGLVSILGIFLFKGIDMGGRTTAIEKEGPLTPSGEDTRTMPPGVKEGSTSAKPPIKGNTLPSPKDSDNGDEHLLTMPSGLEEGVTSPVKAETSPATAQPLPQGTNRAKPLPRDTMVCTVNGEGPDLENLTPPGSNICGIIFFDSLFKGVQPGADHIIQKNYDSFMTWPKKHPNSIFGMSFSLQSPRFATMVNNDGIKTAIASICNRGITHMAVINVVGDSVTDVGLSLAFRALQSSHEALLNCAQAAPSYVVLGASIDQPTAERLVDLMKQNFTPSLFIAISHVSYDARSSDCRILPPAWLDTPENAKQTDLTYGRTLIESCSLLPLVANGVGIPVAISFTLSGRMYKPRFANPASPTPEEYELFRPCQDFDGKYYVSPPEICKNSTELTNNVNTTKFGVFTFDTSMERTLTFDNVETLQKKVCATKDKCGGVHFGLATYDLNYDADSLEGTFPDCLKFGKTGSFSRCDLLHKMHGYLVSLNTKNPWNKSACLTHV